jgi:ATP-dependent DNA ligase
VTLPVPLDLAPMEARSVAAIPRDAGWLYEPKWDGFRCVAFRDGEKVVLRSKSGQPFERYFPEIVGRLRELEAERFVLDGELIVRAGDSLSFDDLLQRIHPAASRVAKLSREHPAQYLIFDLLLDESGAALLGRPLAERRAELERFAARHVPPDDARLALSPATQEPAQVDAWLARSGNALDGIVAKRLDAPYGAGRRDAMVKVKTIRSADCVVAGYRPNETGDAVGSLLLGLYDERGELDYVGFTSGFSAEEKRHVFERLRPLRADASFTGRTPGGPSRWNRGKDTAWQPLRPELVLEVAFDQVTAGRFRHGTRPLRWRPDKPPRTCTTEQLAAPAAAGDIRILSP